MTLAEMENLIKKLDGRLTSVEQILPTLATRDDLLATTVGLRTDLRSDLLATRGELEAEIRATRSELEAEIRATRNELQVEIRATRSALTERIDQVKHHTDVRIEDARSDIRKVAEGVASLSTSMQANTRVLEDVVKRLDRHETVLQVLVNRRT